MMAAAAFSACVLFWVIGVAGGLAFLHDPDANAMGILLGLYAMLVAVAVSIIIAGGAAAYIARTMPRRVRR